jgi:hypothetical protein
VVTFGVNSIIFKGIPIDHLFVAENGALRRRLSPTFDGI